MRNDPLSTSDDLTFSGRMALMEKKQVYTDVWWGNPKTETTRMTKREWEDNIQINLK